MFQSCNFLTTSLSLLHLNFNSKSQPSVELRISLQFSFRQIMAASRKQVEELQQAHDQKIKEQKILEEKRRLMESQQTKVYI